MVVINRSLRPVASSTNANDKTIEFITGTLSSYVDTNNQVYSIRMNGFGSFAKLEYVSFPVCSTIGNSAFYFCRSLQSAYFPKCTSVGMYAFGNCSSLTDVELDYNVSFGQRAFYYCSSLKSMTIANTIPSSLFYGCNSLESVYILRGSATYVSLGTSAFHSTAIIDSSYLGYYGSIYVPSFAISNFKFATNWTSFADRIVSLPEGLGSKFIFDHEYESSTITQVPESRQNAEIVQVRAFALCESLTNVYLPNCVKIYSSAFTTAKNIKTVSAPLCTEISDYAFYQCYSLSSIDFNLNLTKISPNCFAYTNFRSIYFPNCSSIGSSAFQGCVELSILNLPNCEQIHSSAFANCRSIREVELPACKSLSNYAFYYCYSLSTIDVPNCTWLGEYVFGNCSSLATINSPAVTTVYSSAFYNCSKLSQLDLPNCTFVNANAFINCYNMNKIQLPKCGHLYLGSHFTNCSKLAKIIIGTESSKVCLLSNSNTFSGTPIVNSALLGYYGSIYVPDSMVESYKTATNWTAISDRITGISNLS